MPRSSRLLLSTPLLALLLSFAPGCSGPRSAPERHPEPDRQGPVDYRHHDAVLAEYMTGGLVDYAGIKGDAEALARWKQHLAVLATAKPDALSAADRKAFWTNAYNTFCIEGILRNYPTSSPKKVPGFFDELTYRVAGRSLTVNQMQYEVLMPEFKDARLHFILVCADFGCLPLEPTAFTGADIEDRLVAASYRFARDTGRFEVDLTNKRVRASKLFDPAWYAKDFTGDAQRPSKTAVQYMAPWLTKAEREFLLGGTYTVEIIPWDWRLNERLPEFKASK